MLGKDIARLITLVNKYTSIDEQTLTRDISQKLDINIKTFTSWMSDPIKMEHKIGRPYVAYMRRMFESILLRDLIQGLVKKVFKIAQGEFVGFWIICGTEVVLLKDTARIETLKQKNKSRFYNDELHITLHDFSATVEAIQTAQVLNRPGTALIGEQDFVGYHIMTNYLTNKSCSSLLKIPIIIRSTIGPRVVGLLDIQNRLYKNDEGKLVLVKPRCSEEPLFTMQEVDQIREAALKEYNEKLHEIIQALDYLDPETSPSNGMGELIIKNGI